MTGIGWAQMALALAFHRKFGVSCHRWERPASRNTVKNWPRVYLASAEYYRIVDRATMLERRTRTTSYNWLTVPGIPWVIKL